jgi:hypothetical protein
MRIVGFAQTMRLGSTAEEGFEIKVQLDSGIEVSIPTNQDTIMALTRLWAENKGPAKPYSMGSAARRAPAPEPEMPPPPMDLEEEEDEGEVFGGNLGHAAADDMGYPVLRPAQQVIAESTPMPRPRFLETDDDDGNQV